MSATSLMTMGRIDSATELMTLGRIYTLRDLIDIIMEFDLLVTPYIEGSLRVYDNIDFKLVVNPEFDIIIESDAEFAFNLLCNSEIDIYLTSHDVLTLPVKVVLEEWALTSKTPLDFALGVPSSVIDALVYATDSIEIDLMVNSDIDIRLTVHVDDII